MPPAPEREARGWPDALVGQGPLLLLLDFDGTLVPLAPTPDDIAVPAEAGPTFAALRDAGHEVWVVSGRRADDVRRHFPGAGEQVVGLHGLDWPGDEPPPRAGLLDEAPGLVEQALEGAGVDPGPLLIEDKRLSLGFHYRAYAEEDWPRVARLIEGALRGPASVSTPALSVLPGHAIVELRPIEASKRFAVERLVRLHPDRTPVFIGDDATDEEAFAGLGEGGVAVRVGPPDVKTVARVRVGDVDEVYAGLQALAASPCA